MYTVILLNHSRIKEMFANSRCFDCQTNAPCLYQKEKYKEEYAEDGLIMMLGHKGSITCVLS